MIQTIVFPNLFRCDVLSRHWQLCTVVLSVADPYYIIRWGGRSVTLLIQTSVATRRLLAPVLGQISFKKLDHRHCRDKYQKASALNRKKGQIDSLSITRENIRPHRRGTMKKCIILFVLVLTQCGHGDGQCNIH